jgi:WD40 repeat protein
MAEISRPLDDSWVGAVHANKDDYRALGSAVVLDLRRLLTCAHVVRDTWSAKGRLWVAFPKTDTLVSRRLVSEVILAEADVADLALLVLEEDVPDGVTPAPLKGPKAKLLVNRRWYSFGFAAGDPLGNSADGTVGGDLGYGWVRLDTTSRYHLEPGFSGAGLWSPDYDAVVGIVGQANQPGDGKAITFHYADAHFPNQNLQELTNWTADQAGDGALAAWGWALTGDPQATTHWRPRARGVTVDSEPGHRFRGRTTALSEIVAWLDRDLPTRKALVVTGSPGVGKSAVLGRIVVTADSGTRARLPADAAVWATEGSVSCAVHAKGKTAIDVAIEIAKAASAALPETPGDLPPALHAALSERGGRRFNVIIDALDEVISPAEARTIIKQIVLPLVETCSNVGAQVVVGTRRHDDGGDLLQCFGSALSKIDLDESDFFALEDLAAYSLATLQLLGDERPDNPYNDHHVAGPVSARIAELSDRNFLVAGLVARTHGMHDEAPINPNDLSFTPTVEDALRSYLDRIPSVAGTSADGVLTALAFAQSTGLTIELWQVAVQAITGASIGTEELVGFTRSSAGNFLIESGNDRTMSAYRLFHQALNDTLLDSRRNVRLSEVDEGNLTRALVAYGRQLGWAAAPTYLLQSLPLHAARAGLIDELLTDDDYLLYADLRRLIPLSEAATTSPGRSRARLLRLTPQAIGTSPDVRTAVFSVTEMLENLGDSYSQASTPAPYQTIWATAKPRGERALLEGHTEDVNGLCAINLPGRSLVASAGDTTVRVWDLDTGQIHRVLNCDGAIAKDVCAFTEQGRACVVAACGDGNIYVWDLETTNLLLNLKGHSGAINAVCAFQMEGKWLLASAGHDRTVRVWNLHTADGTILRGHSFSVNGLCAFTEDRHVFLASAGGDDTIRIWDIRTEGSIGILTGHAGPVNGVCTFSKNGRTFLASAGGDDTIHIWDLSLREIWKVLRGHTFSVRAVCSFEYEGQAHLASAGDNTVRIWNLESDSSEQILGTHTDRVRAICPIAQGTRTLLASGGCDKAIRIWDVGIKRDQNSIRTAAVTSVAAFRDGGRTLLAAGGNDGVVRLWAMDTGELLGNYRVSDSPNPIIQIMQFYSKTRSCLASADVNRVVIWDVQSGQRLGEFDAGGNSISAFATAEVAGQLIVVSADDSHRILIRDYFPVARFAPAAPIAEQIDSVRALFIDGARQPFNIFSGSDDGTIRAWRVAGKKYIQSHSSDPLFSRARGYRYRTDPSMPYVAFEYQSQRRTAPVRFLSVVHWRNYSFLVSAGGDNNIYIWDVDSGYDVSIALEGHTGAVNSICSFERRGRLFLASASDDRTLRIWAMDDQMTELVIPVQYEALSVCFLDDILYAGLSAGSIGIKLNLP